MREVTKYPSVLYDDAAASLPKESFVKSSRKSSPSKKVLVVLDDDPTGTQTVHDISVLTTFEADVFATQLKSGEPGFFVLTNTRAYPPDKATKILKKVLTNLHTAAAETSTPIDIVLRSDSTLRGYFPLENILASSTFGPYDAWVLAPSFFEGGRVTLGDVHYALDAHDHKTLVPVGETPSAQDKSFGFSSSNIKEWVEEKLNEAATNGVESQRPEILTIGVDDLRCADAAESVAKILETVKGRSAGGIPPIIVPNTFSFNDMDAFIAGCDLVPDLKLLYRTGASFVSARLGIERKAPISAAELFGTAKGEVRGGLVIIGSYVPRTTAQREYLLEHCKGHIRHFELDVESLLTGDNEALIRRTAKEVDEVIRSGVDAVVSTSRRLITGKSAEESLRMGGVVNHVLVGIGREVTVRPKYVIAKGGITSSDVATASLGIQKARVVGQASTGVPLWRSETAGNPKWPDVPYVVFPGNVGTSQTLGDLVSSYRQ